MVLKIRWGWAKTESFRRQTSPSKKMNQETADRVAEPNAKKEQTRRWISGRMSGWGQCPLEHGEWWSVCLPMQETRERQVPSLGKSPCSRKWQPTPVSSPGKSRGQRSLSGYRPWGCRVGCDQAQHLQNTKALPTFPPYYASFHFPCVADVLSPLVGTYFEE